MVYLILLIFTALYSLTLFPGVGGRVNYGDSAKWQYIFLTDFVPHPTGYPTYILLSKIFNAIMPFEFTAHRITVISVIAAVLTLLILYRLTLEITSDKKLSFAIIFSFGTMTTFWSQATEAEVYTLNSLFLILIIYLLFKFYKTRDLKYAYPVPIIYALSLGNHATMVYFLPFIVGILAVANHRIFLNKKFVSIVLVSLLIFAGLYLYIFLRFINSYEYLSEVVKTKNIVKDFLNYLTGAHFKNLMWDLQQFETIVMNFTLYIFPQEVLFSIEFLENIWVHFFIFLFFTILFILSLISFLFVKENRAFLFFLLISTIMLIAYSFSYVIGDIKVYFIPIFMIMFIFLAFLYRSKWVKSLIYLLFILSIGGLLQKFLYFYHTNNYLLENELNIIRYFENTPILFLSYSSTNIRGFYARKMLENYIDTTKDFGNYEFVEPYEVNMGLVKSPIIVTRGWLFNLQDNNSFKTLKKNIYSRKINEEFMFFPLDEVVKLFKNKIILIVSMDDTSNIINNSKYFVKFLKESGSKLPENVCKGIAYVGLFYKGKVIKESFSKSGQAHIILKNVKNLNGLNIPERLIAYSYGMKDCDENKSVLDIKVSLKTEEGIRSFYMTYVSNVIFVGRKYYEANDKGLHVFVFDENWNLIKRYLYYKVPYEYNDMFLVR